ncbi:ClpP family protease [Tissierella praeacuta]|uniref:ATP-dependent protease ClpP, protease subunit n=3 Tax=Tissierella praeacuta TaxID=43131 RepID=A0A1M4SHT4_9FIRM|nr:ATP-dependent Clp protease proteolytic subunit [Tissierella praeacuta]MBU5254808.1 ATP-dependent Clp protease proteolytic subunit [Tissierella praeacuta]TCU72706.1 ATP-dependent protease ClpP protease subunit [Tissierella praeacuta]SHE31824.1 ATP-dependent protease ClpP, protease subunit [Tissierella praeacuta DSM 18095]SUP01448.1 Clp protease [Tissierella praeacuta]
MNKKNKDDNSPIQEEKLENIKEIGTVNIPEVKNNIQFISIIGEIEGHTISPNDKKATKYEHIIPLLIAAQQDPKIEGIFIILNTVGGDVEAGLALSELINSVDKPKVSLVLGGGHSIGVPLATSTDYSFIVPTATMTIHPIRTTGLVIGVPQTFRYFQKMQQRIINFILRTSEIDDKTLNELMYSTDEIANDVGTILVGEEAVKYKLIDEVGGFSRALKKLDTMIEDKNK